MSSETSVFQTSGGGYDYEHYVQSGFLTTMILQGSIPIFPNGKITEICFQCKNKGYTTDDLFLEVNDVKGTHRILAQIKYNIALTEKNQTFIEVIDAFWQDFNKSDVFDKEKDKLFLIKSGLTNDDKNHINVILDWAATHKDENDFFSEVERIDVKNQKLLIFSKLLSKANGGVDLSKKQIWEFLKCFKLISYDFASENSTDQSNILNLISLSKSKKTASTSFEIWNSLLVLCTVYNRNGGSIDLKTLKGLDVFVYFDLSITQDAYLSLQKLIDDGNLIFKPIINTVKGFHVNRNEIRQDIFRSIMQNQVTFVTGAPGVGKSALIKELLGIEFIDSLPFIFKADQFNKSTLSQVFSGIGITYNLSELVSTISLLQNKIIIIDSGEKLLEGDPDSSFKQLLELIKENTDLKMLVTSRSYAVNIIVQKYSISNLNLIEIPTLSDIELQTINNNFPQINKLLDNKEVKEILRSPKYLEFALNAIDKSEFQSNNISLTEFKDKLWFQIIENGNVVKSGIARKREKTFSHIAIGRAINMGLFFQPDDNVIEYDAVDALLNDDVISKNGIKYEFTPSHDILEDWALIRHISLVNTSLAVGETLFEKLGNQPALRRAFRLWIEELILTNIEVVLELVKVTLKDDKIERYWVDEILTAIFRSKDCKAFFDGFRNLLIESNAAFLNRCILICRTTCKEYSYTDNLGKDILLPIGSAWEELLDFIAENYEDLHVIRNTIFEFLLDWECKYIFTFQKCTAREIVAANFIAIFFIKEIESQEKFWFDSLGKNRFESLLYLVFNFAPYDEDKEIEKILHRTLNWEKKESSWNLDGFYEEAVKIALGGVRNQRIVKKYPDLIIDLATKNWKSSQKKRDKIEGPLGFNFPERKEREDSWGVKRHRFDFFPSGVYKTFVYNILQSHPTAGIKFIVDFTNYMITSYSKSDYGKSEHLIEVKIHLNSGVVVEEYSNDFLWQAYRGTVVTHGLLESILVGFEKYMLEMADTKDEIIMQFFQTIVDYCLKNSNSVIFTSIFASIFTAYPKAFGKSILPILKCKECYEFDLHRATREHSALAVADHEISFAQQERYNSNQLPHRKKYTRGLRDFIFQYQFTVGELNTEIFEILDSFYKTCADKIWWEKAIYEMDSRKYKASKVKDRTDVLQLEVEYPEKVLSTVITITEERKYEDTSVSFINKLPKVIDGSETMTIDEWKMIHLHYTNDEDQNSMFDMPVSLAVIGLKDFLFEIDQDQKRWSVKIIANTLFEIAKQKLNYGSFDRPPYNILEEQLTIESTHLLFSFCEDEEDLNEVKITIAYLLISHLADHEQKEISTYFRTIFFEKHPEFTLKIWSFLILYAKFDNDNKSKYFRTQEDEKAYHEKKHQFILENILDDNISDSDIDFENYEAHFLALALLMINVKTKNKLQQKFILDFTGLLLQDSKLENGYSNYGNKKRRRLTTGISVKVNFILNEILLYNEIGFSTKLLNVIIAPFLNSDFKIDSSSNDMYKFSAEVLSTLITRFDDIVLKDNDAEIEKYGIQFWKLWEELYSKLKSTNKNYFAKEMLLDAQWGMKSDKWKGFINKNKFYEEILFHYGTHNFDSVLRVSSTFGERVLLPERLPWIVKFLKENPKNIQYLGSNNSKLLIKKLFDNHIGIIKNNQNLVSDFMFILNNMVDIGLPEAYLVRECVIIYKRK